MIAIGIHFNARLHIPALKADVKRHPRLDDAESGSMPFAGLRDAVVGAFIGDTHHQFSARKTICIRTERTATI